MSDNKELHLLIPIVIALILNYLISVKKWEDSKNSLLPSAPFIGFIWIIILVCLGNAHYILNKKSGISFASMYLIFVIIYCLSYPVLIQLNRNKGAIYNIIAMILTSVLLLVVYEESSDALLYTIPLFVWISFVNYSDAVVCSGALTSKSKTASKPKRKSRKNDFGRQLIVL